MGLLGRSSMALHCRRHYKSSKFDYSGLRKLITTFCNMCARKINH
jgi:hypothetical protein